MSDLLHTAADTPIARLLLAHGAGAPMDSPFLVRMAELLAARRIDTWRFEFPYMAARRTTNVKRPAPKAETLVDPFRDALAALEAETASTPRLPILIGGKSMGGRVASMVADDLFRAGRIAGCACLGYPFHPPNQPQTWRIGHLQPISAPVLIVQGERDPFGTRAEIDDLMTRAPLSPAVRFAWIGDGDHDFGPRGGKGFTRSGNLAAAADAVEDFAGGLAAP